MNIQILIGMPLWYAKSVLEKNNIAYKIKETVASSRFFVCDENQVYVVRATMSDNVVILLTNYNLAMSDSVQKAYNDLEGNL